MVLLDSKDIRRCSLARLGMALILASFSMSALADNEPISIRLVPLFRYKDFSAACKSNGASYNVIYFSATLRNNALVDAQFSDTYRKDKIKFLPEELNGIEFEKSPLSSLHWLRMLPLSTRLLSFIFFHSEGSANYGCKPSFGIASISPKETLFQFPLELAGANSVSISNRALFRGSLTSGGSFRASLAISQSPDFQ